MQDGNLENSALTQKATKFIKAATFTLQVLILKNQAQNVTSISIYIISSVMHAFWLVLIYDLLEDRRIDDVIIKTFFRIF